MKKYRLRWNKKIVGYAQESSNGILFKGKEWLWFMRGKPRYNQIDEYIEQKDKWHREIYEGDIVLYKVNEKVKEQEAIVLWENRREQFMLYNHKSKEWVPLYINEMFLFENDKLEIISHLFNQPELENQIQWKR